MNIVNVIASNKSSESYQEPCPAENGFENELNEIPQTLVSTESSISSEPLLPEQVQLDSKISEETKIVENEDNNKTNKKSTKTKKTVAKKTRASKSKPYSSVLAEKTVEQRLLAEKKVATMPTLVFCPEAEVQHLIKSAPVPKSYIPIAPKPLENVPNSSDTSSVKKAPPKLFFRTVNVPCHLVNQSYLEMKASSPLKPPEAITLYAGDENAVQVTAPELATMPVISLDESSLKLTEGTGLSPFFKGNIIKVEPKMNTTVQMNANKDVELQQLKTEANDPSQNVEETTAQSIQYSEKKKVLRSLPPLLEVSTEIDLSMNNEIEHMEFEQSTGKSI